MVNLPLHPNTKKRVNDFVNQPSQVLAIVGPAGSGKRQVALHIVSEVLKTPLAKLDRAPNLIVIKKPEDKQEIPIDDVRQLINKLKVKSESKRLVLIEDADLLSLEAQNALLKTLEQPGKEVHFILTIRAASAVLPTVLSRASRLIVSAISKDTAIEFYKREFEVENIIAAWSRAEGAAGKIDNLLKGTEGASSTMTEVKDFLRADRYGRLLMADKLSRDRAYALEFVESLYIVIKALHHANIKKASQASSARLLKARKMVDLSAEMLKSNTSAKLVLLNLAIGLPV